jgi:hydrogenase maturation protein HypF
VVRAARAAAGGQAQGEGVSAGDRQRLRVVCRGVVQGVGFRPAVHRLASSLGLGGFVRNGPEGVVIEVEGADGSVQAFVERLPRSLPPLARIDGMETAALPPIGESAFSVLASQEGRRARALVPPDSALCPDCRAEMDDPSDRRYRYPFTTCTNCGPRFTLVRSLPYDRERTSMACFPLCPACRREYEDPANRRFHAEPVCCPECGPRLWLEEPGSGVRRQGSKAIELARQALEGGKIVAVKGFGGFQLACRADDEGVVARLRERKRRPSKPFAVMVRDLDAARRLVRLAPEDEALLASPQAPVLLAPALDDAPVAGGIAPGLGDLGVMLPTAPLHVELFREAGYDALVMTSGNASDEPICRGNREAVAQLARIADLFLIHDRDVVRRADDSVARTGPGGPALVRRARGYVPEVLPLPVATPRPVLALGPYLQVSACLAVGEGAFCSQHVGDLDSESARAFLAEAARGLEDFLEAPGDVIVVDSHPDYPSTWLGTELARGRGARLLAVQHHLAHAAAVLAEHERFPEPGSQAAAIALDGTGWGPDGVAWGGEWLLLDGDLTWRRIAHLEPLQLVGGEVAVLEPWRVATAALAQTGSADLLPWLPLSRLVEPEKLTAVAGLAERTSWPRATGAGRVFEAAGALLGLSAVNGYEGEGAARLEALAASSHGSVDPWPEVLLSSASEPPWSTDHARSAVPPRTPVFPSANLLAAAAQRLVAGEDPAMIAAGFHATFCRLAVELTERVVPVGVRVVALGGGCLVNRLLRSGLGGGLSAVGYEPLLPVRLPAGDGGLSYGQAVLGVLAAARGGEPRLKGAE